LLSSPLTLPIIAAADAMVGRRNVSSEDFFLETEVRSRQQKRREQMSASAA
jgi:hypothetical protein